MNTDIDNGTGNIKSMIADLEGILTSASNNEIDMTSASHSRFPSDWCYQQPQPTE